MPETERKKVSAKSFGKLVFGGGIVSFLCSILLIFLCAVMVTMGVVDYEQIHRMAISACAVSIILVGFCFLRHCRNRGVLAGMSIGIVEFVMCFITYATLLSEKIAGSSILPFLIVSLCSGALVGLLVRKRKRRRM